MAEGERDVPATEHEDERGIYYITQDGQRYHYEWCHDCGGAGCDYCDGVGQVRLAGLPMSTGKR